VKRYKISSFILAAWVLVCCNKSSSSFYTASFYIRVPLIENNDTYLVPSFYYDQLNFIYNAADRKRLWKIVPANDNAYNIAPADSISVLVTADTDRVWLAPKNVALADNQKFRIVPSANDPLRVAFQSPITGKYIQIDYCHKGNEPWASFLSMDDSSHCEYQGTNLYSQSDTCYCRYQFVLERN
jgi:hypothetical protein